MREVTEQTLEHGMRIIIPFWGMYLMEARIAAETPIMLPGGLVYFERFRRMANVTRKMNGFVKMVHAGTEMPFEANEQIQAAIRSKKTLSDEKSWWNLVEK